MITTARILATLALSATAIFTLGAAPATPVEWGNFHDDVRLDTSQVEWGMPCTCP